MHHYVKIVLVLCSCLALTTAQFGHYGFSDFSTNFGAPSYSNSFAAASTRDPRSNQGPVLFPDSPRGDAGQTSGVIVGASGYGFVPPSGRATNIGHLYGPTFPRYFYRTFYARR